YPGWLYYNDSENDVSFYYPPALDVETTISNGSKITSFVIHNSHITPFQYRIIDNFSDLGSYISYLEKHNEIGMGLVGGEEIYSEFLSQNDQGKEFYETEIVTDKSGDETP